WNPKAVPQAQKSRIIGVTAQSSGPKKFSEHIGSLILFRAPKANKLLIKKNKINTSSLLAFRLKLLSETLPSRQLLHDRYPSTYRSLCLTAVEIQSHIFNCYKNIAAYNKMENKIRTSLVKLVRKNNNKKFLTEIERRTQKLDFGRKSNLDKLASGMLSIDIQLFVTSHAKMANKILALLYSQIWIPRLITANTSEVKGVKWKRHTLSTKSPNNIHLSKATLNNKSLLKLIMEATNP
ncbi:6252_t:CDS:2, partial [Acaulospora morrowiae]